MAKVIVYKFLCWMVLIAWLLIPSSIFSQYLLHIHPVDKDSVFVWQELKLQKDFKNQSQCASYVNRLPALLKTKGYPNASVDSIRYDSLAADMHLYIGEAFRWAHLNTDSVDGKILDAINWNRKEFLNQPVDFQQFQSLQRKLLDWLENNGYPFARIHLDSVVMKDNGLYAQFKVQKGPLYKIDSIRNYGNARISDNFLQRYLNIMNGSIYRKSRLQEISKKLNELPYAQEQQPWNLTMLGTGSILNVYLVPKRSSQVNVLLGFMPSNQQFEKEKLLITGEANINLKNALGNGETIGLNWQQIQVKSPRLNILFQQPYLFGSAFGAHLGFDLFKKDSSFVNINMLLGVQYTVSSSRSGSVFLQNSRTNLLAVDTLFVKTYRRLPQEADMSSLSLGITYELYKTNYRYNPHRGNELLVSMSAGTKNIKKNEVIGKLKDNSDPSFDFEQLYDTIKLKSYQFRIRITAAHYFPLTRASTLKTAVQGGWFQSPNIFRNELFQLGGYKLLRGFDEESIYASQFAVATFEYRYMIGQNSFLFSFVDAGWIKNTSQSRRISNRFTGAGLGMAFETKAGIFNISIAAGKRDDVNFSLRQTKIHIGYVNYF